MPRGVGAAPLLTPCDVNIVPTSKGLGQWARDVPPGGTASFEGKDHTFYSVRVYPTHYRPVQRLVQMGGGSDVEVQPICPVDPQRVTGYEWPDVLPEFPGLEWEERPPNLRAGFLNIHQKAAATPTVETNVLDLLRFVHRVYQDRVFYGAQESTADVLAASAERACSTAAPADSTRHRPATPWATATKRRTPTATSR